MPVVASSIGEAELIIQNGQDGFLAKHENDFKVCIEQLLKDEKLRETIGRNARKKIDKFYSLSKVSYDINTVLYQDSEKVMGEE